MFPAPTLSTNWWCFPNVWYSSWLDLYTWSSHSQTLHANKSRPLFYWLTFRWCRLSNNFLLTWGIKEREKKQLTACCNFKKVFFVTPGHRLCRRLFTWLTQVVILWFRQVAWRGVASLWSTLSVAINQRCLICQPVFGKFGKTNIGPTDLWLELFQRLQCSVFKRYPDAANDTVHIRAYPQLLIICGLYV